MAAISEAMNMPGLIGDTIQNSINGGLLPGGGL
jgi:hypothetical protein